MHRPLSQYVQTVCRFSERARRSERKKLEEVEKTTTRRKRRSTHLSIVLLEVRQRLAELRSRCDVRHWATGARLFFVRNGTRVSERGETKGALEKNAVDLAALAPVPLSPSRRPPSHFTYARALVGLCLLLERALELELEVVVCHGEREREKKRSFRRRRTKKKRRVCVRRKNHY